MYEEFSMLGFVLFSLKFNFPKITWVWLVSNMCLYIRLIQKEEASLYK